MKRVLVIFLVLLLLPIVYAEELNIPEIFPVKNKIINENKEIYFYGNGLVASFEKDFDYNYEGRLNADMESKTLPFGQPILTENRFSFTGKELDDELYYFNARYYNSELGRFTTIDPVKNNHPYSYVNNNPMNLIDPTGMDPPQKDEINALTFRLAMNNVNRRGEFIDLFAAPRIHYQFQYMGMRNFEGWFNGYPVNQKLDDEMLDQTYMLQSPIIYHTRGGVQYFDRSEVEYSNVGIVILSEVGINSEGHLVYTFDKEWSESLGFGTGEAVLDPFLFAMVIDGMINDGADLFMSARQSPSGWDDESLKRALEQFGEEVQLRLNDFSGKQLNIQIFDTGANALGYSEDSGYYLYEWRGRATPGHKGWKDGPPKVPDKTGQPQFD